MEEVCLLGQKKTKIYQASTSELYGLVQELPQSETTPIYQRSPYAFANCYVYWITRNYMEAYSVNTCSAVSFNFESPQRGETFVARKTTRAMASRSIVVGKSLPGIPYVSYKVVDSGMKKIYFFGTNKIWFIFPRMS